MTDAGDAGAGTAARRLRILFFLYHGGYLRHYAGPLEILAERGHVVHLAFTTVEKDPGDRALAERLAAEAPNISFGEAPTRGFLDGWRRTGMLVRAFTDLARYIDPRYADAPALRARMAHKIRGYVRMGKADPVSARILVRLVDRLAGSSDPRLGRRLLSFLGALEDAIPTSRRVDRFIRAHNPDVVLATPLVDFASTQVEYLKSARRLGIPTGVGVASWDNLTNKGLLRFVPDRVLVWNEIQRRELEELHGIPGSRAIVTGGQKFDEWFERRPTTSPEAFRRKVGLDDGPFLLYVCSSPFIAPDEVSFVRRWLDSLRESGRPALERLGVVVRPHPQNAAQWRGVDLAPHRNAVVWPAEGAQPDAGEARADFFDSLAHSEAVVGVNTSAMIEAAIVGKNVFTVLDEAFAGTQEGTLHFHYMLRDNGGFLEVAHSLDEHVAQLERALAAGSGETERIREFVHSFIRPHGLDVPAAPLVADAVVDLAETTPERRRPRLRILSLRAALFVPTLLATASALVGTALHSLRRRAGRSAVGEARVRPAGR